MSWRLQTRRFEIFRTLKGHAFSRAVEVHRKGSALAAEGRRTVETTFPQGLKPDGHFVAFAARLKSCPFKTAKSIVSGRFLSACIIAALLVALAAAALLSAAPAAAKKRHHAASTTHSTAKGRPTSRTSPTRAPAAHSPARRAPSAKATQSSRRLRVHYYAGPRIDTAHKAALIEEIGNRLKDPPPQAISYGSALEGFYAQLEAHESELRDTGPLTSTVRVMQFGDSHTAADMFTGEARRVFQEQFGNGGIGYSYPGHPFAGYRILGSGRSQSTGWRTQGNHFLQLGDGQTGLGGISISTLRSGEWVTLDAPCSTLELQYLQQPGGGTLRFSDNGIDTSEIQTDAAATGPGTYTYFCTPGEHHFDVTTEQSAPVTLLGWVATQPGVTWESIGINGAEAPLILKWDQSLFSKYLKDNSPALIVLAYGTNEAASSAWDEESYEQAFASIIDNFHQYVPESSILVVGPPDRSVSQHRAWHPYAGTDRIIDAQRAVCRTHGCAYWDQRKRMGGFGAMQEWVYAGWAQPDHTHFTGEGYRELADALLIDIETGYQAYKKRQTESSVTTAQGVAVGNASSNP